MYTLDTNAIIYYLKGDKKAVEVLESLFKRNLPIYISCITELELFSFPDLTKKEVVRINELLQTLNIIPVDSQLARLASFLRSKSKIKTPDSIIAATAVFTGSILLTRNVKDFEKVVLVQVQEL
ncbi:type II toxin-antitoxin system VapC family toxin [Candidatus Gracilibacteria bacterium]|nr:type II toxin-antitoxin system VapC family toxin [Candidatus Gracilibacteria bacterium]